MEEFSFPMKAQTDLRYPPVYSPGGREERAYLYEIGAHFYAPLYLSAESLGAFQGPLPCKRLGPLLPSCNFQTSKFKPAAAKYWHLPSRLGTPQDRISEFTVTAISFKAF